MSLQASGYFTVAGNATNQTVSIVINGVNYSLNVLNTQSYNQIAQNYSNYLNTQSSFTQYFNSTYSGNNFYINVNPGSIYDGNAGNKVIISSTFSNSTITIPATGYINSFASQNPQYGNSTLTIGPFSTSIFVDAYSDQSTVIANQLNENPAFFQNFIASSSENFLVHFATQNNGAYPGATGNGLLLSISPYGSASGPSLQGGTTDYSITLIPNNPTLQGGEYSNVESLNNFIDDFSITNIKSESIISQIPLSNINIDLINNQIFDFMRLDLYDYLVSQGLCSPQLPVMTVEGTEVAPFVGDDGIQNFQDKYYYRITNSSSNFNLFSEPYAFFPYPSNNINYGKSLVKVNIPINGNLPNDIVSISDITARNDLYIIFNTIFAL